MRFGLTLGVDVPPSPSTLVELVTAAERLGFASFWLGDHVVIPRVVDDAAHQRDVGGKVRIADKTVVDIFEPLVTLAYLAGQVRTIRLGLNGWMEGEFTALGASFADRGAVTDEYIEVMVQCWTQEHPSYDVGHRRAGSRHRGPARAVALVGGRGHGPG